MPDDPVVTEIRQVREAYAASMDYDLRRIVEDIKSRQGKDGHPMASRKPVPIETPPTEPPAQVQTLAK